MREEEKREIETIVPSNKILATYYDQDGKIRLIAKNLNTQEAFEMLTAAQDQLFDVIKG